MKKTEPIFHGALSSARNASSEFLASLEAVRNEIAKLKLERRRIENSPVELSAALERVDKWIESAGVVSKGRPFEADRFVGRSRNGWTVPDVEYNTILTTFLLPLVGEIAKRQVSALYENMSPLSDEELQAEIRRLDRRILDLELTEEAIIRSSEMSSAPILRRADADPLAVLAHDKSLP